MRDTDQNDLETDGAGVADTGVDARAATEDTTAATDEQWSERAARVEDESKASEVAPAPLGLSLDDPALAESERLAREALAEVTRPALVGALVRVDDEGGGVYSLRFETTQRGYVDWLWTVAMNRLVDEPRPNVLETELLPGVDALLAPAWVPWADRLAEYEAAHADEVEDEDDTEASGETAELAVSSRRRRRTRVRVDATSGPSDGAAPEGHERPAEPTASDEGSPGGGTSSDASELERPSTSRASRPARGTVLRTGARRRRTKRGSEAVEDGGAPTGAAQSDAD